MYSGCIVMVDVVVNRFDQLRDVVEDAVTDTVLGDVPKPAFYHVQP
jgi:hypothetical protein